MDPAVATLHRHRPPLRRDDPCLGRRCPGLLLGKEPPPEAPGQPQWAGEQLTKRLEVLNSGHAILVTRLVGKEKLVALPLLTDLHCFQLGEKKRTTPSATAQHHKMAAARLPRPARCTPGPVVPPCGRGEELQWASRVTLQDECTLSIMGSVVHTVRSFSGSPPRNTWTSILSTRIPTSPSDPRTRVVLLWPGARTSSWPEPNNSQTPLTHPSTGPHQNSSSHCIKHHL
ncbi:uncharacterized protein [Narcine bancroftii]|uniref:uncharacterized protein n=1 Tax=Narcine bancroftii TaxID=1343680 RepID=UPI003831942E